MTRAPTPETAGFTLIEVVISLVIVAGAFIPLLSVLGDAAERVLETTHHRKIRYLIGMQASDILLQKKSPQDEDEEEYEEGQIGNFEDYASDDSPDEYESFEYALDVYRDEVIIGGEGEDDESHMRGGWEQSSSGSFSRPVSNDWQGEEEEAMPSGQMKRLLVLSVRWVGEDADLDVEFRVMTYLPVPGEEERQLGGEGGGPGGEGAGGSKDGGTEAKSDGASAPSGGERK